MGIVVYAESGFLMSLSREDGAGPFAQHARTKITFLFLLIWIIRKGDVMPFKSEKELKEKIQKTFDEILSFAKITDIEDLLGVLELYRIGMHWKATGESCL